MTSDSRPEGRAPAGGIDRIFLVQLTIVALSTTAINAVRPMITYRALDLGAGALEVGLLAAVFSITPAVLAIAIGRSIDRIGEVWFIRAAVLAMTVGAVLAVTGGSLVLLAISQMISGLGHVTNLIAGQALVANRGGRSHRDYRYGYYSTVGSLGHLVGPLLAASLVSQWTVAQTFVGGQNAQAPAFLAAAVATVLAFALALILPKRRPRDRVASGDDAELARRGMLVTALGLLRRPGMPFAMLVSTLVVSSVDVLLAYLPLYGEARGLSVGFVGLLLAIRAGASMVSRVFLGYLIGRVGHATLLIVSMGAASAGLMALPFMESPIVLAGLMAVIGLGLGLGQPVTMTWVASRSPREERGTALALRLSANRFATVLTPVAVGAVAAFAGVGAIFWVVAIPLGAGAVAGYLRPLR